MGHHSSLQQVASIVSFVKERGDAGGENSHSMASRGRAVWCGPFHGVPCPSEPRPRSVGELEGSGCSVESGEAV
jgi:hypothetical protein